MGHKNLLYYESKGQGEPLVLISGLNTDHLFWALVQPFLEKHFKVITIDNRGAGKSQIFTPECTTELMAQDVIDLLDSLNIQSASFIGHSLGGCVAQQIALNFPKRVNKLVLCSTTAKLPPVNRITVQTTMEMMTVDMPREILVKSVLTRLFSNHFLSDDKRFKDAIKLSLSQSAEDARRIFTYQANALLKHDTTNILHNITAPTFIISGEEDLSVPIKGARYLADNIPTAKLLSVPDMGHMLPIEDPEYFSQCAVDFLR